MYDLIMLEEAKERYCIMSAQKDTDEDTAMAFVRGTYGGEIADIVQDEYMVMPPSIDMLNKYIEHGIDLIPAKKMGERFIQLHDRKTGDLIKVGTPAQVQYWVGQGIDRFLFIPRTYGFLCIDIDRGHGNGGDGVKEFYAWLKQNHLDTLSYFKDLDAGSFPCYATTPSGGLHLYFKCKTDMALSQNITPNVEVKHGGKSLTASGSRKDGRLYVLHGNLTDAPIMPMAMLTKIAKRLAQEVAPKPIKAKPMTWQKKGYTPEQCLEFARKDSAGGNHNTIFQMAQRLEREGIPLDQALAIIKATPEHQNREHQDDTDTCVKSVYKDKRR